MRSSLIENEEWNDENLKAKRKTEKNEWGWEEKKEVEWRVEND